LETALLFNDILCLDQEVSYYKGMSDYKKEKRKTNLKGKSCADLS
jgi:hypothetical protein